MFNKQPACIGVSSFDNQNITRDVPHQPICLKKFVTIVSKDLYHSASVRARKGLQLLNIIEILDT